MVRPVVLDVDESVGPLERRVVIPLSRWCEPLRFACSSRLLREFGRTLEAMLPEDSGTVFTGSSDFHHLSLPLIQRVAARSGPLEVVVFDNQPGNMRFPFGVHCGSWVRRVVSLPGVKHVHVVGITSADIGPGHAWENRLWPLLSGRLSYWSIGAHVNWADSLGLRRAFRNFACVDDLLETFARHVRRSELPIYLSVDKSVLSIKDARTGSYQGCMRESELRHAIEGMQGRIVGSDITGDVSVPTYSTWWKRLLAAIEQQPFVPVSVIHEWRSQQHYVNQRLLEVIEKAYVTECAQPSSQGSRGKP